MPHLMHEAQGGSGARAEEAPRPAAWAHDAAATEKITLAHLPLRQQTGNTFRDFVDEHGRQRIFHGTNVVVKGFPWIPERGGFEGNVSLATMDLRLMEAAGFKAMRLGLMWPGAEPARGAYNETYFAEFAAIVDEAGAHGIYMRRR